MGCRCPKGRSNVNCQKCDNSIKVTQEKWPYPREICDEMFHHMNGVMFPATYFQVVLKKKKKKRKPQGGEGQREGKNGRREGKQAHVAKMLIISKTRWRLSGWRHIQCLQSSRHTKQVTKTSLASGVNAFSILPKEKGPHLWGMCALKCFSCYSDYSHFTY